MKHRKTVLMFGWEFPPHISGGLGTACFGLTQSLAKQNVKVLFVVPKLHGNEPGEKVTLINASDIVIPPTKKSIPSKENKTKTVFRKIKHTRIYNAVKKYSTLKYIEVPSTLTPYNSNVTEVQGNEIEQWNYEVPVIFHEPLIINKRKKFFEKEKKHAAISYQFSGTYGANLMQEVARYAEVGYEIAKQSQFDVIHAHDWMTYAAGVEAKKISGKPLVVHVHATEIDRSGSNVHEKIFALERAGMHAADKVITVSQLTKDIVIKHYEVPAEKVSVVHNGIIPKPATTVAAPSTTLGTHLITFLGRVTYQKGPQYFIEAARKVLLQFPNAHFVMAGSGDLLPQMIERVAQLKLSSKFHFTGFLRSDSVDKVWGMSDLYVMPSVSEPFGITPLEAIQSGVPVILSNQSGVSEVMNHALKVDFWNTDALASAICSVLKYKSLSDTLRTNGELEIKNLTWDKAAKKIDTIYHEISTTLTT